MGQRRNGPQFSAEASKGSRSWMNERFPVHHADADEALDQMEQSDFAAEFSDTVAGPVTECLAKDCTKTKAVCRRCALKPHPEPAAMEGIRSWHAPQQQAH